MRRQRCRGRPPRLTTRKVVQPTELADALAALVRAFEVRFGRPPGPDDPIFFDPDADTPTPIAPAWVHDQLAGAARVAGVDPRSVDAAAHGDADLLRRLTPDEPEQG